MQKRGFTLIELLIVLVIIGVLMGLLLPALGMARIQAKRTKARHTVDQIAVAWQTYLANYRMFPSGGPDDSTPDPGNPLAITEIDTVAAQILVGSNYNSQGIVYMELSTNEVVKGLADPWGSLYKVVLDNGKGGDTTKYNGKVEVPQRSTPVSKSVAVWSKGPDMKTDASGVKGDDIKNWE